MGAYFAEMTGYALWHTVQVLSTSALTADQANILTSVCRKCVSMRQMSVGQELVEKQLALTMTL